MRRIETSALSQAFAGRIEGDVLHDAYSLGRYATDASIYQVAPLGVVCPRSTSDIRESIACARSHGVSVLPRGGGTSQCGQTVNRSLVLDHSKYLDRILDLDVAGRTCTVEPGIVLDDLNRALKPHGLWFPVDVSTASRATIGGMAANNSCGGRSLRYGTMRDNVLAIEAILQDGQAASFGPPPHARPAPPADLVATLLGIGAREAAEIDARFPRLQRRVGGYNLDALTPQASPNNLAHLLVGSEGTLAFFTKITLALSPLPGRKSVGICHFPSFRSAMEAARHLVALRPQAVELVDATMIDLARGIPIFRKTIEAVVTGTPAALLLVEFAEDDPDQNALKMAELEATMADLGLSFDGAGARRGGVVAVDGPQLQTDIAELRKAGLNIMMSMKDAGKPVSFVEDCAVALTDLADYTEKLTAIFDRHGTRGTWYAHASVGCLHVRPVLNLKLDQDVATMRAIAEECFELVHHYKGSHSGEHGDGIVRSEFHERMFGPRLVAAFNAVKDSFDPQGVFNPNRIVQPPRMDDRSLFRFGPDYAADPFETGLDWSAWPGEGGGFQGAVEMCNNNGACRKLKGGVMCPSFRVTRNERDVVRGRANTLRLAITGQLGPDALTSDEMAQTMELCVSCKACRRECPTGVDMARMKIEVLAARNRKTGPGLHDRLIGQLPRYAPLLSKLHGLANLRDTLPGLAALTEGLTGLSRSRKLPRWSPRPFRDSEFPAPGDGSPPDVLLFADVFNRYFQPETLRAAGTLLRAAGLKCQVLRPADNGRALDCGRSLLSVGMLDAAKIEARRLIDALLPFARQGIPVVGLEPSSLLTLRDEIPAMWPGPEADLVARHALLFEEFFAGNPKTRALPFRPLDRPVLLHGHCHQKSHDVMTSVERSLALIPGLDFSRIETSCCGMAGSFGYATRTTDISLQMGELDLFPAIRRAPPDSLILADGFSCRHQIFAGTGQNALHVVQVLEMARVQT